MAVYCRTLRTISTTCKCSSCNCNCITFTCNLHGAYPSAEQESYFEPPLPDAQTKMLPLPPRPCRHLLNGAILEPFCAHESTQISNVYKNCKFKNTQTGRINNPRAVSACIKKIMRRICLQISLNGLCKMNCADRRTVMCTLKHCAHFLRKLLHCSACAARLKV